jgi:hypothetical protein
MPTKLGHLSRGPGAATFFSFFFIVFLNQLDLSQSLLILLAFFLIYPLYFIIFQFNNLIYFGFIFISLLKFQINILIFSWFKCLF